MKAKPILIIVVTLAIGFVLGMLTSAQLRFNRLKPVRLYFSEELFREGFYKMIEPDEKQKAEIEKILEKYGRINSTLQGNFRKEFDTNMKAFRKEIDSKLTKEQLARLKEIDERTQEMIRQSRRSRNDTTGPGGMRRFGNDRPGDGYDRFRRPGGRPDRQDGMPPVPPRDTTVSPDSN